MPWSDRLPRAKYRGIEFLTDSHEAKGGRRLVVFEYPGADGPAVEDLGGAAWNYRLNAYFIGPDYDLARNEFLDALFEPGPDWLTHPWLGEIWVRAQEWSVSESNERGGYCTVAITFVPGGELPEATPDERDAAAAACVELADAAESAFDLLPMSAAGLTGYIAAVQTRLEALRRVVSLAALPSTMAAQVLNVIQGVKGDLSVLAAAPNRYASAFRGIANALGLTKPSIPAADRPRVVGRTAQAARSPAPVALTGVNATDTVLISNLAAERALEQRLLVAAALACAVAEPPAGESTEDAPTEAERAEMLDALEKGVAAILPAAPDRVFQAAATARAAVQGALEARVLQSTVTRRVVHPLPSALLAYRLGVSEERFLRQNRVRHPLFVQGEIRA
jgi:prophage DNA circulation protein